MYEAFYGFKEKPFSMLPDPGFLFLSKKHQTALTLLEYGLLNHVGFCVVTGEPGAGKTTIIRALLQRVSENITVGLITNTHQSFGGLLDWVLSAFDLHRANLTSVEMHQIFMEFLIEEYAQNRTVLLVVDEAQNMQVDTLEELRMLSNVNSEKDQLLQVVLSGQPALKEMLLKPELMQFAQRISVDYHLDTLNVEETCGYIQHRLRTAGAQKDVFTPAACRRIHTYSGGTPRLINLLCETVLVYGFADQLEMIDVDLVDEMVQERMKDSVVPIVNRDAPRQDEKSDSEELDKDFPWISPKNVGDIVEEPPAAKIDTSPEVGVTKQQPVKKTVSSSVDELVQEKKTKRKVEAAGAIPAPTIKENKKSSAAETQSSVITGDSIAPAKTNGSDEARSQLLKYGIISVVFALLLIVSAVMLNDTDEPASEFGDAELIESQEQQREKVRLQIEAEALAEEEAQAKKEALVKIQAEEKAQQEVEQEAQADQTAQDKQEAIKTERAATARLVSEKEKQAKIVADKLAAEQAVKDAKITAEKKKAEKLAAEKAARKKSIRDEQKRIAIIKAKEKEEKYALERERRKAAKIAEEKRLIEEEDARRLEREWLENERLKALESSRVIEPSVEEVPVNEQLAVEDVVSEPKVNNTECSGPTARFKASCR